MLSVPQLSFRYNSVLGGRGRDTRRLGSPDASPLEEAAPGVRVWADSLAGCLANSSSDIDSSSFFVGSTPPSDDSPGRASPAAVLSAIARPFLLPLLRFRGLTDAAAAGADASAPPACVAGSGPSCSSTHLVLRPLLCGTELGWLHFGHLSWIPEIPRNSARLKGIPSAWYLGPS